MIVADVCVLNLANEAVTKAVRCVDKVVFAFFGVGTPGPLHLTAVYFQECDSGPKSHQHLRMDAKIPWDFWFSDKKFQIWLLHFQKKYFAINIQKKIDPNW